jgi:hypothetical protein
MAPRHDAPETPQRRSRADEEPFDESWFEPDLSLATERYFADRRRNNRRALLIGAAAVAVCGGLGFWASRLWAGGFWPRSIPLAIPAVLGGFIALALFGAAGTQFVYDQQRAVESKKSGRLRNRDRRTEFLEIARARVPFVLYLRNFDTEVSEPTRTQDDFVPVDIHRPRWDSRLEDFALAPVPRRLAVVTVGFVGRDFVGSRSLEVFLADATWTTAFEWLARRANLVITVLDQETEGVQKECATLRALVSSGHAPPIWMMLNSRMRKHPWALFLAESATWVTDFPGVPRGDAPAPVRDLLLRLSESPD